METKSAIYGPGNGLSADRTAGIDVDSDAAVEDDSKTGRFSVSITLVVKIASGELWKD